MKTFFEFLETKPPRPPVPQPPLEQRRLTFRQFVKSWDEKLHPRAPEGMSIGGQFVSKVLAAARLALPKPKFRAPEVVQVEGDEWNLETAHRLERQYEAVHDKLEELANDLVGEGGGEDIDDEDSETAPDEWDDLDGSIQEQTEEKWKKDNWNHYYDSEVEYWHGSGDALNDAKNMVIYRFNKEDNDWAKEALDELLEEQPELKIPYNTEQLLVAIKLDYEHDGDLEVNFVDENLPFPPTIAYHPAKQLTAPGIEPQKAHDFLTKEMRKAITDTIEKAFEKKAEDTDVDPPDYLSESVDESLDNGWDNMDDDDKFEHAKGYDLVGDDPSSKASSSTTQLDRLPTRYDPLNEQSDADYRRTQLLARRMSIERGAHLILERGLGTTTIMDRLRDYITARDADLWSGWKGSSTTDEGLLLQVATAEELGGRVRIRMRKTDTEEDERRHIATIKKDADYKYEPIGGFAGIKALVRAKWETTQFLLDKADKHVIEVYRGIDLHLEDESEEAKTMHEIKGFKHMPNIRIKRNGCASTTLERNVANNWGSDWYRTVLRIAAPRTAVVSIPAYGQNMHHEREVVVAGTAWKKWDAWRDKAPLIESIPIGTGNEIRAKENEKRKAETEAIAKALESD